jgi:hypothetical protein
MLDGIRMHSYGLEAEELGLDASQSFDIEEQEELGL